MSASTTGTTVTGRRSGRVFCWLSATISLLTIAAGFALPAPPAEAATVSVSSARPRVLGTAADFSSLRSTTTCDALGANLLVRLRGKADSIVAAPVVAYDSSRPDSLYEQSQTVLDRSSTLSIAYQLTGNEAYASRLWTELSATAAYPDWNPVGHFLATSNLTEALGIGYDSAFGYWNDAQKETLQRAIVDKGLKPAITRYEQNVAWESQRGNFNVVANTGIIMGALAVSDTAGATSTAALEHALASLESGRAGYSPDGGYREGPAYWGYATQALVTAAKALTASTGSDQGIWAGAGIAETGGYALQMTGTSGESFNYGDSKGATLDLKARPADNPAMLALGSQFNDPTLTKAGVDAAKANGFNQWAMLWYGCGRAIKTPGQAGAPLDRFYKSSQTVAMRSAWDQPMGSYVGFKAASVSGNSHPELDAGTFVLDALGVNWATDLGPDSYALPGYHDSQPKSQRWLYYRKRAEGNNTLVLNPGLAPDQSTIADSSVTTYAANPSKAIAVADLTPSVSSAANSWKRGVQLFDNRKQVLVQDEIAGKQALDVRWGMHTDASIAIAADGRSAVLTKQGQQMLARLVSPGSAVFTQQAAKPAWTSTAMAGQASNPGVRKLSVHLGAMTSGTVAVQFSPVRPGLATPPPATVQPLSSWTAPATSGAALSSLSVGGVAVPGFNPGTLSYDAATTMPSTPPSVSAVAPAGTSVSVQQPIALPGVATVTASKAGVPSTTYTVFVRPGNLKISYAKSSQGSAAPTIDRDETTSWLAAGNQTLQYNFADRQKFSLARIKWGPGSAATSKFGLIVSDDGIAWRTVKTGSVAATGGWMSVSFPSVTTKFVGIRIDSQGISTRYVAINEVQLYSEPEIVGAAPSVPQPAQVTLGPIPPDLRVRDSFVMSSTVKDEQGSIVAPTSYTQEFVSSNPGVVKVAASGTFTGVAAGQAVIGVVITSNTRTVAYQSVAVTVTDPWKSTINPSADTYVNSAPASVNTNYGSSPGLLVKSETQYSTVNRETYFAFDLSPYRGKTVVSAKLVYQAAVTDSAGTAIDVDLHSITGAWTENTVTYATKPKLGPRLGGSHVTSFTKPHEVDVTTYIAQQATASANASLALTEDSPPNGHGLLVYVSGKDTSRKPYLEVETAYVPR